MLDELFLLNGVLNIGDSIPWLDWMDLQGYIKRMKKLSKMFDRFLEHVVEEHNQRQLLEGKDFVAKDMVDVLLQIADDPTLEVELNRESVKAFTQVSLNRSPPAALGFRCAEQIRCCRILHLFALTFVHIL